MSLSTQSRWHTVHCTLKCTPAKERSTQKILFDIKNEKEDSITQVSMHF